MLRSKCGELCATCTAAGSEGTCSPAASDPRCDAIGCPAATECRAYDETAVALNCEGIGACRESVDCEPINQPAGTACQAGTGACNDDGACVVPGKALLGEPCAADDECAEGHCIAGGAGICCDAACDGVCQQCSADGRCDAAPPHDERCDPVVCPSDNPCRDYPDTITENLCRGFGQCRSAQACVATALRPAASCDCDAELNCTLRLGVSCAAAAECTSGACQLTAAGDSVCCAEACGGRLVCASDGSGCVECEASGIQCDGDVAIRCVDGRRVPETCGNGCAVGVGCNIEAPVGFACVDAECVAGAVCQADVAGTLRCCTRDCAAEGKQCAPDGSCVCPPGQGSGEDCRLQRGEPCGNGAAECGSGLTCVDGVCCNEACGGACESCNLSNAVGTCTFDARDTAACGSGEQCVGRGDCRGGPGLACDTGADCVSANCESLVGVSGADVCCAANCSGATPFCSTDGSRCVECQSNADCGNGCSGQGRCNPLRALGDPCNVDEQCTSGECLPQVDDPRINRCCPQCAAGQLCSADGRCQDPPAQAGASCTNDSQCAAGLFCRDGVCCTSACNGPCQFCNANGTCNGVPASDVTCGPVTCALQSTECRTVMPPTAGQCLRLGQCVGSAQCTVVPHTNQPCNGGTCNSAGECVRDTTAPSVGSGTLSIDGTGLDNRTITWNPANDGATGTPAGQLVYQVYHSFANDMATLQQTLAATPLEGELIGQTSVVVRLPRNPGGSRAAQHFFNVVVRDANGNRAAYRTEPETLVEASSCSVDDDCLSGTCRVLYPDADRDCRGDEAANPIRRCATVSIPSDQCLSPLGGLGTRESVVEGGLRYVDNDLDCYDRPDGGELVYGGQTRTYFEPAPGKNPRPFDYNCDGREESSNALLNKLRNCPSTTNNATCTAGGGYLNAVPACGETDVFGPCAIGSGNDRSQCSTAPGGLSTRHCR